MKRQSVELCSTTHPPFTPHDQHRSLLCGGIKQNPRITRLLAYKVSNRGKNCTQNQIASFLIEIFLIFKTGVLTIYVLLLAAFVCIPLLDRHCEQVGSPLRCGPPTQTRPFLRRCFLGGRVRWSGFCHFVPCRVCSLFF